MYMKIQFRVPINKTCAKKYHFVYTFKKRIYKTKVYYAY